MKKILLMFLLVIGLLLTGCGSTSDDPGDDNPKDPTGVTDPLDGIDEALVLLMDGDFEGEFDGNTISYYFYLPVHTEFTFSLDADFDSLIVIKELLTSNIVFEGDDSIFGDDVNSFISLDAGEYVVELSSRDGEKGSFSITLSDESIYTSIYVDVLLNDSVEMATIKGYLLKIEKASYYSIVSIGDLDLEGALSSIEGEFLSYGINISEVNNNFEMIAYLEVGSYIIGVAAHDIGASGSYQLLVEETTLTHTTVIAEDTFINDILIAGEKNTVEFVVTTPGEIQIYTVSTFDSYGTIYDTDGEVVAFNDDGAYNSDFYIDVFLESGTYTIEVKGVDDYEAGSYVLVYDTEEGDSSSEPDEEYSIDLNSNVTGTLGAGELHSYTFTIPSDGKVTAYLVSDFDSYGAIVNSDGNVVEYNDDASSVTYDFKIENYSISQGTYSVYVKGYDISEYGNYTLYITFEANGVVTEPVIEVYPINLNSNVNGTLGSGDIISYTFTVTVAGNFTAYIEGEFESLGYLKNSIGMPIMVGIPQYGSNDFRIQDFALTAGTYSFDIVGFDPLEYGDFTLYVEFEENGSLVTDIIPNQLVEGNLSSNGIDIYSFTIERGGYIHSNLESTYDTQGTLSDVYGVILLEDDDSGDGFNFELSGVYLDPGYYEISINGFSSEDYGNYVLSLDIIYGNLVNAIPLELPSDTESTLDSDDYDWYKIEILETGYITAYLVSSLDTYGYLVDEDGGYIDSNDDDYDDINFYITAYLEPGTYYIVVCGYDDSTAGDYSLHVGFSIENPE